ncbi:hypothetical protein EAI_09569 [Harpegnathos saltator]|uniref:Uncharacterized protein n=1 Tax=Harpegnathos saltator TaxID=610380 RepID=E2BQ51_HARSA|nr:hypothetical protein EAI_09569 [Harpegnathos saltator]
MILPISRPDEWKVNVYAIAIGRLEIDVSYKWLSRQLASARSADGNALWYQELMMAGEVKFAATFFTRGKF